VLFLQAGLAEFKPPRGLASQTPFPATRMALKPVWAVKAIRDVFSLLNGIRGHIEVGRMKIRNTCNPLVLSLDLAMS
jgi:hypothetical protein